MGKLVIILLVPQLLLWYFTLTIIIIPCGVP